MGILVSVGRSDRSTTAGHEHAHRLTFSSSLPRGGPPLLSHGRSVDLSVSKGREPKAKGGLFSAHAHARGLQVIFITRLVQESPGRLALMRPIRVEASREFGWHNLPRINPGVGIQYFSTGASLGLFHMSLGGTLAILAGHRRLGSGSDRLLLGNEWRASCCGRRWPRDDVLLVAWGWVPGGIPCDDDVSTFCHHDSRLAQALDDESSPSEGSRQ